MEGIVISADFVVSKDDDEDNREPGTYITIRLDDDHRIRAGRVRVDYIDGDK